MDFLELSRFHDDILIYNNINHFVNLPHSLKQIKIGTHIYNSVFDLLNNYEKNLNPFVIFFESLSKFNLIFNLNIKYIYITIKENDLSYINMDFFHSYDFDRFEEIFNQQMELLNYPNPFKFINNLYVQNVNFLISKNNYELITLPSDIKEIEIYHGGTDNIFPVNNLPSDLEILEIQSYALYELSNLPNKLKILRLIGWKHNLDSLPPNLKFLEVYQYDKIHGNLLYELNSFVNLPHSLKKIIVGEYSYESVSDLLDNYEKNIENDNY